MSADLGPLPDGGVWLELLGGEDPLLGVEVDAGDRGQGQVRVRHLHTIGGNCSGKVAGQGLDNVLWPR